MSLEILTYVFTEATARLDARSYRLNSVTELLHILKITRSTEETWDKTNRRTTVICNDGRTFYVFRCKNQMKNK